MVRVLIDGSDTEFECAEDDTILRAALRAGLGFPYECNVGSCGNCRFQVLEGEVEHLRADPPAWSERDLKKNRYLGCQARPERDLTIKVRLSDDYVSAHRPARLDLTLTEVVPITHDISEFRFAPSAPQPFLAGQYALLYLPDVEGGRAYSMSNASSDGAAWEFQIKRVPGGAATEKLFDALAPGDPVRADGPFGMAYLREDSPRDILCLAGGSGLSPMISIARTASNAGMLETRRLRFFYGGRTPEDMCGEDLLRDLPGFGDRITYTGAVSDSDGQAGWSGPTGFVHDVALADLGDALADHEIYFAGPPAMAQAVQKMLFEAKVPRDQIHFDEFY